MGIQEEDIIKILDSIPDPKSGLGLYAATMISGIQVADGQVVFMINVDPKDGELMEPLRQRAEAAVAQLSGVRKVSAILTAERHVEDVKAEPTPPADPHGMNKNPKLDLPIKHIIAVASGKGGVGKSTVAFNLAYALGQQGLKVGLMDADIYGPSVPTLAGLPPVRPEFDAHKNIIPFEKHGLKIMSIGFMVDPEKALVWRGPMVQTAIYQLLRDVIWGREDAPLDVLIIDMPPGTGDAQLTLAQKVSVSGAVIVSTPQDLALIDTRKGIEMFTQVNVPILGVVENMSTHICSQCGHEDHVFGQGGRDGGVVAEAEKLGVPVLGHIPLDASLRQCSDEGAPSDFPVFADMAKMLRATIC